MSLEDLKKNSKFPGTVSPFVMFSFSQLLLLYYFFPARRILIGFSGFGLAGMVTKKAIDPIFCEISDYERAPFALRSAFG